MNRDTRRAARRDEFRQKNADRRLARRTTDGYSFRVARLRRRTETGPRTPGAFGHEPARVFNELAVGTLAVRRQEKRDGRAEEGR